MKSLKEVMFDHILVVLEHCKYNKVRAAEILGIHRRTLGNHLKSLRKMGYDIPQWYDKDEYGTPMKLTRVDPEILERQDIEKSKDKEYIYTGFASNAQRLAYLDNQTKLQ